MQLQAFHHDPRSEEQIRAHYEVERELSDRLRNASQQERKELYTACYEELYQRVPYHRKLDQKATADQQSELIERQMRWLRPSLTPESTFLEVGAGDCIVTFAAAELVKKAIAVEVSYTMAGAENTPDNFELIISDGISIPVPDNSVDIVYSQQLMEHLHPEDAYDQLKNIYKALAPGGKYFCVTPNRTTGPHDISRHYDQEATCFHLKEYTIQELAKLFKEVGFRKVALYVATGANPKMMPVWPAAVLETALAPLPRDAKIRIAKPIRPRVLFSFRLLGIK